MRSIILNSSNVVADGTNSKYLYKFPSGSISFKKGDMIAVQSIGLFYSWFNITSGTTGSRYNNNSFSYTWGGGAATQITLPDGYYTLADLNSVLQQYMYSANQYCLDENGSAVYFLELIENVSYYAIQVNSYPVPLSATTDTKYTTANGYTFPTGFPFSTGSVKTPQLVVSPSNAFGSLIGFAAGSYPPTQQAVKYFAYSSFTPQMSPVSSLVVQCSLLHNRYSLPTNLLYSFSSGSTGFGDLIQVAPAGELPYNFIEPGAYADFLISFVDQDLSPVMLNDTNLVIMLTIKNIV